MILNNFLRLLPPKSELIRNSGVETLFLINSCFTSDFAKKEVLTSPLGGGLRGRMLLEYL